MAARAQNSNAVQLHEITTRSPQSEVSLARELLLEYGRFVIAQPGTARFCFGSLEKEASGLPHTYTDQGGGCLLAAMNNAPVGFIAWRALAPTPSVVPDAWELKRLWVRPVARGVRLGQMLTQAVLDRALAAGRKAVYLDTAPPSMGTAHRMYLRLGFLPCAPYNDNPVEGLEYLVKFL